MNRQRKYQSQPPRYILHQLAPIEFYRQLIKILKDLTGVVWGYMAIGTKVIYVTSAEIPLKIVAAAKNATDESIARSKIDIHIKSRYPSKFPSEDHWRVAVLNELQVGLLKKMNPTEDYYAEYAPRIRAHVDIDHNNMIDEVNEQNQVHADVYQTAQDHFSAQCEFAGFG